jgi:hypothetical protein
MSRLMDNMVRAWYDGITLDEVCEIIEIQRVNIGIEITENDLELLHGVAFNNETIDWTYISDDGVAVNVEFMSEDELMQRSK